MESDVIKASDKGFIEKLFDANPNLIYIRDNNGRLIYCNQAVVNLAGISREELMAGGAYVFPDTKEKLENIMEVDRAVIDEEKELMIEEQITDKHGTVNYFQTIKKPLKMKDGDVALLNISTNINQIKFYQQETSRAMQAQEDFFSAMSHEIRTPLNAVIGIADLLLKRNPRSDQLKLVRTLNFSAKNLMGLINDVLDFSKIRAGKTEVEEINFNLRELLGNIKLSLSQWATNKRIGMELELAESLPEMVKGDHEKLSQILNNLLGNAIKFTDRGSVTLKVALIEVAKGQFVLRFNVIDTGIGIPNDKLSHIFEPFQQVGTDTSRKYGGTGLGLSIVKNLIEIQGGSIHVESEEDSGTIFVFELPFLEADQDEPVPSLPVIRIKDLKWKMKLNVLYVEDVATNQFLIKEILSDWGINVDMVSSGEEALEKVNSCLYDMILMDIQMPGIDGLETTRRIRAKGGDYFKEIPIIAMTASTSESTKHEIYESGMQDLVKKPISADDLRSRMIQHIQLANQSFEADGKLASEEELKEEHGIKVIFDQTDKLFSGNVARYQEFLRMSIEEFTVNLDLLLTAISQKDLESFRKINHRMKNLSGTLGINYLLEYLESIKQELAVDQMNEQKGEEMTSTLKVYIEKVIDIMGNKKASLKWQ